VTVEVLEALDEKEWITFNEINNKISISKSNLREHLRKMQLSKDIESRKITKANIVVTQYRLRNDEKKALEIAKWGQNIASDNVKSQNTVFLSTMISELRQIKEELREWKKPMNHTTSNTTKEKKELYSPVPPLEN